MQGQKVTLAFLSFFTLLAFVGLACAQAGRIIPDADATALALPTATEIVDLTGLAEYQVGETVSIVGGVSGALVPLYGSAGGRFFSSQILHGEVVLIESLGIDEDGELWYEVDGLAGTGWTTAEHLAPLEETVE